MTVKELLEVFKETNFINKGKQYYGSKIKTYDNEIDRNIRSFGVGCYGGRGTDVFEIKKNNVTYSFDCYFDLEQNKEILDMEVICIEKIFLDGYWNESASHNCYLNDNSKMIIRVK